MLRRMRNRKGFTLIELMIVVAIIGILAAIAIPMYRSQQVRAKMSEGVRAMNTVASAIGDFYNEEDGFPGAMDYTQIYDSLGVGVVTTAEDTDAKISALDLDNSGAITVVFQNCGDDDVDTIVGGLVLTPTVTPNTRAIFWTWTGAVPAKYIPKK